MTSFTADPCKFQRFTCVSTSHCRVREHQLPFTRPGRWFSRELNKITSGKSTARSACIVYYYVTGAKQNDSVHFDLHRNSCVRRLTNCAHFRYISDLRQLLRNVIKTNRNYYLTTSSMQSHIAIPVLCPVGTTDVRTLSQVRTLGGEPIKLSNQARDHYI